MSRKIKFILLVFYGLVWLFVFVVAVIVFFRLRLSRRPDRR